MRRLLIILLLLALPPLTAAHAGGGDVIRYLNSSEAKPALGSGDLLEVHLINVASADCILLRLGEHTMLIDSGTHATYERVTKYLASIGVDRLEYAFGSHPHDDHIGGFPGVMDEVSVETYLQPTLFDTYEDQFTRSLKKALDAHDIPVRTIEDGTTMAFGGATLTFFQWQKADARINNRSMMIKIQYGDRSILLAADVESHAQNALAEKYGDALRADILKVPHHGMTRYNKDFYDAVQAQLGTVSNIKDRVYDTLRAMEKRGMRWMLVTKGTVVEVTDGETWQVWQILN